MPNIACHGCAATHATIVCQLARRPESTPSVRVKRYSAEKEMRSQYISAKVGKIHHVSIAAAPVDAAMRKTGNRARLCHPSTPSATARLTSDPREYESTSAAKKTAPP